MNGSLEINRTGIAIKKIVKELYNCNLDGYHEHYLERRLSYFFQKHGISKHNMIRDLIINEPQVTKEIQKELQICYTRLFREPSFFRKIGTLSKAICQKKGSLRIWHVGCSNGAEVYSLAILLKEQELLKHTSIYATDINDKALLQAGKGLLNIKDIKEATQDYSIAGGNYHLLDYFTISGESALCKSSILNQIKFAKHELGKDHLFHEFDIIICRNMLIYYQNFHQIKLIQAMKNSLRKDGYIGLSSCESLEGIANENLKTIDSGDNIYQLIS